MNKFIFHTLRADPLSQPFVPERKFVIDPGTAVLLSSAVGGLLGLGSQSSANSTNLEIAKMNAELQRETNAQNYQIFKENQSWNEDMWNKQNEYNLPTNQVQRLLDAGINPASVYGNGSVTPAGSVGSVNTPNMVAPRLDYRQNPFDFGFVPQAVNAYFQNELVNAQKKKLNADTAHTEFITQAETEKLAPTIQFLENQAKKEGVLGDIARDSLRFLQDTYWYRFKSAQNDVRAQNDAHEHMQEQIYNQKLMNGLAEVQLAYAPKMQDAQLNQYYATCQQIKAQIGLILANETLSKEQALSEIKKRTGITIDNNLKNFDLRLKNQMKKFILMDAQNNSSLLGKEVNDYEANWWNRTIQGYIPFASGSATAGTKALLK